ncbi:hypothetical protein L1987_57119 [Smallanthus sonchifolius]|uniref:Uncharacterized protein n=1 Tax=Smallanthus sonchifolius TaxID=185202 RepID=A0ACB9DBY4_9ASTR|nr:hypothetical protein L1987_57119 [Smallanthus sonchifolius]
MKLSQFLLIIFHDKSTNHFEWVAVVAAADETKSISVTPNLSLRIQTNPCVIVLDQDPFSTTFSRLIKAYRRKEIRVLESSCIWTLLENGFVF